MDLSDFVTLQRTTTPQQVADGLQDMILKGALLPGDRINESTLSRDLGISRNTMREAVRLLEATGLLRPHPRRGMQVWDPTDEEILDLFAARFHLETLGARQVAGDVDLTGVRKAFDEFAAVLEKHDPDLIVEKDLKVHQSVVALLDNAFLASVFEQLLRQIRFFAFLLSIEEREYEDHDKLRAEHEAIVKALESRNAERAAEVVGDTVLLTRDEVREAIRKRRARESSAGR
ncbi:MULTISPECIES: GntR family transcriptional regulator [Gordonia]|uniref:DNA-binding transcriptional regulator, GntR family n=1 Tax=Gordonia westfalica TaxID=158898 RepID=A0A1H2JW71_9ACTN|nr:MULTISPECIES: GntR family transcriptional regulator [Gordonia]QMU22793.1 GntR family transcriptional regulator [Gordonia rubripertincta]SDU60677.1 DNA-binding transcriptional regulator, GntR family [Gordonia westfalica]